jgi:small-conductance mechanosensitive channel
MYCPKCGNQVADTETFCKKCGNQLNEVSSATSPGNAPTPLSSPTSSTGSESRAYAGFWRRVFAYLIDYVIVVVAIVVTSLGLGRSAVPLFWPLVVIGGVLSFSVQ